jgi:iron only hydrogenase large subunit-like protein
MELRKSQDNPAVQELYKEFLGEPGGHKAHEILHTSYVARKVNF